MHYTKTIFGFSALILFSLGAVLFFHVRIDPATPPFYRKLAQESFELRSRQALEREPIHQSRQGVQKDIWTIEGDKRPHFRLIAKHSELILSQKKDKVEAVERLQEIDGSYQDEILRTFQADEGLSYFPSHRFQTDNAHIAFFRSETPYLKGDASSVVFDSGKKFQVKEHIQIDVLEGNTPFSLSAKQALSQLPLTNVEFQDQVEIHLQHNIIAKGSSAHYEAGSLMLLPAYLPLVHEQYTPCQLQRGADKIDAETIHFDLESQRLTCKLPKGKIFDPPVAFTAQKLTWDPNDLSIEGEVQLFSCVQEKESVATADRLTYNPTTKTILLTALPPKKVLFWQKGLTLRADQVEITEDPITQTQSVKGLGIVHFAFEPAEQQSIENLISKYL